jgi:hypothetical protein
MVREGRSLFREGIVATIAVDQTLVAYCGLYCGACPRYTKGRCPGCHDNHKATWCRIRSCNIERGYASCADCTDCTDPHDCGKFHNLLSRLMGVVFQSDRRACVLQIRERGLEGHAQAMAELGRPAIRPGTHVT